MSSSDYPLPLLVFLSLVVSVSFLAAVFLEPFPMEPGMFLGGGITLAGLIVLHWRWWTWLENQERHLFYVGLQGLLIFLVIFWTRSGSLWLGLGAWAFGEAAAMVWPFKRYAAVVLLYALAMILSLVLLIPGDNLHLWFANGFVIFTLISIGMMLFARERRARSKAQELAAELETANQKIAAYARQSVELTKAAERQRFARELHDTLAQGTAGIILQLEAAAAHLKLGKSDRGLEIVESCMNQARETLLDTRQAIDTLREGEASGRITLPLSQVAEWLKSQCRMLSEESGISFTVEAPADNSPLKLPSEALIQGERILGEAWQNAVRHGGADHLSVELGRRGGEIYLKMEDRGCGFSPGDIPEGHYGIRGMRERASLLGGNLEVLSVPGRGTSVVLFFPAAGESASGEEA